MLKNERQEIILQEVNKYNRVLLTDLALKLEVSEDTIRRDLKELDVQGKVKKVHGGAISNSYNLYNYKAQEIYAHESKVIIAKKACKLLQDGQVILMSGGTTNLELARLLPKSLKATFFTPSLPTAMQLLSHDNIEVILIGGKLSKDAQIALGGEVINALADIRVDICFLGTGHLDSTQGLSEFDWEVVQMKKAMINASKKVVSLSISEKLNTVQRYTVCKTEDIDILITELDEDNEIFNIYKNKGLKIL